MTCFNINVIMIWCYEQIHQPTAYWPLPWLNQCQWPRINSKWPLYDDHTDTSFMAIYLNDPVFLKWWETMPMKDTGCILWCDICIWISWGWRLSEISMYVGLSGIYCKVPNERTCLNKRAPSTLGWNISLKIGKNWSKMSKIGWKSQPPQMHPWTSSIY